MFVNYIIVTVIAILLTTLSFTAVGIFGKFTSLVLPLLVLIGSGGFVFASLWHFYIGNLFGGYQGYYVDTWFVPVF